MLEPRYTKGETLLKEIVGRGAENTLEKLNKIAPDVGVLLAEYFGDFYSCKQLDVKTREMITISVLAATEKLPQLKVHLQAAFNVGCSFEEIKEIIITQIPYIGFPTVLNALEIVQEFADENEGLQ
jgi:4-carboxymuconolactone decarboxylase